MDRWMNALGGVIQTLLRHPGTSVEQWVLIAAGAVTGLVVLAKVLNAFSCERPGWWRTILCCVVGLALILGALAAIRVLAPAAPDWWSWVAVGGVSLVIMTPLVALLHKAGFGGACFSWLLSMGAVAGVVLMVGAGFDAVASGSKDAVKAKTHKGEMEQLMGK